MIDAKATLREVFMADEIIRELLPNRKSFLKAGDLRGETKMPVLTFRDGPSVNIGENLFEHNVYIRVYDDTEMGTINISAIGRRMKELVHLKELPIQDGRFVKCKLMNTLGEMEDPAYHKNFVQYQFRVLAL